MAAARWRSASPPCGAPQNSSALTSPQFSPSIVSRGGFVQTYSRNFANKQRKAGPGLLPPA